MLKNIVAVKYALSVGVSNMLDSSRSIVRELQQYRDSHPASGTF